MNDNELRVAIDAGFAEVRGEFVNVNADIGQLKADVVSIKTDINELKADVVGIKGDIVELKADVAGIKGDIVELKADVAAVNERVTAEAITTRRHFDVVAEGLRSDIALLATAVTTVSSTLERSIAENRSEHATFIAGLDNHEVRLTALERPREVGL